MKPIDRTMLGQVMAPVATARGLPNPFYTDPEVYELEKAKVFAPSWVLIGFGKDLAEPGMAKPVDHLGVPLVMVRDRDGQIRVFQNVCRHRGMILVSETTRLKGVLRCPYHSWCYELDGKLRSTPHVGGPGQNIDASIRREELGLVEVRSTVWMDMVLVNLSGTAPAFEDHAHRLIERYSEFARMPLYHGGPDSSFKLEVKTNWKLAVENYCESYHLPWVHPGLNSYSRLEDHYHMYEPGFAGQGSSAYTPGFGPNGERFAKFASLSDKWDKCAEYPSVFPNALLGFHNDHYFTIMIEPVGHDRTIEHVEIYYADPQMLGEDYAAMRQRNAQLWKGIFVEDIFVVEGMQRGRAAPGFDGGKFSPAMDGPTHAFHHWVAERFAA
ncbi:MAG: aromatic ring-hydroxylating dioxygenase subunit alpha [Hyphomicrobiaceae bacterium]